MTVRQMFHVKHQPVADDCTTKWRRLRAGAGGVALLLAACFPPAQVAAKPAAPAAPAAPTAPAHAADKVTFADNAKQGEAERKFGYDWPAAVSAIPELVRRLTEERDTLLAAQKDDWEESLREFAGSDCFGCVNRDYQKTWEVVANLPRFLSLSAPFYEYSGGAHGNYAWDTLVWDREAKAAIDPKDLFTSADALQAALGAQWCKGLKAERAKRLGPDYTDDGFFQCPPVRDLTVLVGSSDRKSFNRIGLIAAPYVAGSYAEGYYELTFPVTPKVLAAVKPAYRAAFALGK